MSSEIFKVVDLNTGRELGVNEDGEIWIRGPQIMKGYFRNEKATRDTIDDNGWLHTGRPKYGEIIIKCKFYLITKDFLALLDYVSRAYELAICSSSVVCPSSVRPSVSQLSLNLMHGLISNFSCGFLRAIRSNVFF